MHTHPDYILREAGPDHLLMGAPDARGKRRIVRLNESAAFLWRSVAGKTFDAAALAALLQAEYGLDPAVAEADAQGIIRSWLQEKLVFES
jgi:hypothetical protein